jgi:hypothetical protein
MALVVTVLVNSLEIGSIECVRAGRDYSKDPDAVHQYHVQIDDEEMGTVEHRYGDDKWALIMKALMLRTERRHIPVESDDATTATPLDLGPS